MLIEERLNAFRFVRREIVDNDVDLAAPRLSTDDVLQEFDEGFTRVPRYRLADDLTGLRVEGRIQRERAM